jgi:hypothetical protein
MGTSIRDDLVPRQNYDLPRNQSDRSVAGFACLSVSNGFDVAATEAPVCHRSGLRANFRPDLHGANFVRTASCSER